MNARGLAIEADAEPSPAERVGQAESNSPSAAPEAATPALGAQRSRTADASKGEVLQLRGRKAHIRRFGEQGASTQVLAAHGWAAHGGRWASFGAALMGEMGVIAPDLPGYGRSDPAPQDGHPVFVHDAALLAELAEVAPATLHLIGAGPGAEAAARIALRYPQKTASLTLIEPAAFALLEEAQDPRRMEALDVALGVVALASYGEKESAARLAAEFWGGEDAFDALSEENRAYAIACADRAAAEMQALSRHTPGALLFDDYARIEAPMLVISGARAPASVRACAARIRRAAPLARAVELPDTQASRSPQVADAAARDFLRGVVAKMRR